MNKKAKNFLIQIGLGVLLGLALGGGLAQFEQSYYLGWDILFYFLAFSVIAFIIHIVVHEAGHGFFGYLYGFELVSFRIASYMWVNDQGKIHFKRLKVLGTLGQCLMQPPKNENLKAAFLYNIGGGLTNLLTALLFFLLSFLWKDMLFQVFCFSMIAIGVLVAFSNLLPMDAQAPNDGYHTYWLLKESESVHSLYQQLLLAKDMADGKRMEEMDPTLFELYENANMKNPLNICIAANKVSYLIDKEDYDSARALADSLLKLDLDDLFHNSVFCDRLLIALLCDEKEYITQAMNEKTKRNFEKNRSDVSKLLVLYGIDLLVDKNHEKARVDLKYLRDAQKNYPYQGIVESMNKSQRLLERKSEENEG